MYFCGNLKERELTLCWIPSPVYRVIKFFTRDRKFCAGGICSYCGALVTCFLFPLALLIALVALIVVILLILAFMPIFTVLVLPFLLITRCRRARSSENVVKITDAENEQADTRREQFLLREVPGLPNKQSDLVTAEVKQEVGGTIVWKTPSRLSGTFGWGLKWMSDHCCLLLLLPGILMKTVQTLIFNSISHFWVSSSLLFMLLYSKYLINKCYLNFIKI